MPGLYSEKLPQGKGVPGFDTGRKSPQVLGREQQLASLGFSVVFFSGSNSRKGAQLKVLPGLLTGRMAPQVKACVCLCAEQGHRRATGEAARGARSFHQYSMDAQAARLCVSSCVGGRLAACSGHLLGYSRWLHPQELTWRGQGQTPCCWDRRMLCQLL